MAKVVTNLKGSWWHALEFMNGFGYIMIIDWLSHLSVGVAQLRIVGPQLRAMSIEVIGIDHIYVTASDLPQSEKFYDRVMTILGFRKNTFTNEGDEHIQYYNRHFGFVLQPARSGASRHDSLSPGLHHLCFRVEDSAPLDLIAKRFIDAGVECSAPRLYTEYAPDYYAIFFSDPDGIRLEITNYRQERRKRHDDWEYS
jgi:glyoxylase I family protein